MLGHPPLDGDRAFDRGDYGRELDENSIAHRFENTPAVRCDDRGGSLTPLEHGARRPGLVLAHEARIADDVGGEDRGELAGGGHGSGSPALRRPSTNRSKSSGFL